MNERVNFLQDGHKLLYHLQRVTRWQNGDRVAPIHLELGTGPGCNFRCIFCFTAFQKKNAYSLERETFLKVMKNAAAAGVKSIGILGDGEPTLNPHLSEAVRLGASLGLDIGLATNGLLFSEDLGRQILPHLVWVRFTTCAATTQTFERVHRVAAGNFLRVMRNIESSVAIKRKLNLPVTIGVQMVLVPENIHEAGPAARQARRLGVDYFVAKQASLSPNNEFRFDYDHYDRHLENLEAVEKASANGFLSMVAWKKIRSHGIKSYGKCYGYQFLFQVTGKGQIYPCSELVDDKRFLIGDLREQSLDEILESDRYATVIANMEKSLDLNTDCASCCRHDAINEFLWRLKNPPDHINFI